MPGAVVLGYHRVATSGWDPLNLAVTPDHFSSHVECLKELLEIVSLRDLVARRDEGERLDGYAALTFDDGYRDFCDTVLPILEGYDVPATAFIATGFAARRFWWDEIAALMGPDPGAPLAIRYGDGEPRHYGELHDPARRAAAARHICSTLVCAGKAETSDVLAQLRSWANCANTCGADAGAMSWSQLESVARHPLVDLGAHTVSHGCLAKLAPEAQRTEVEQCKLELEARTGAAVSVFSYPNGSFSSSTYRMVEALGFAGACTSRQAAFTCRTDRYRIPRIWPRDVPASQFRSWLGAWVGRTA